jgi:ribokinase
MIPLGDKIKVTHAFQSCGGSAANTSIGFSKMGFRTGIIGFIGDDEAAQYITTILQKKNVNTNHLEIGQHGFSSFSVILNASNGQRTVFHHRNTQEDFDPRHIFNAKSNALYIGHLYGKSEDMLQAIPEWKSNNRSRIIAWNPGKTQFQKGIDSFSEIFPFIDVLVLNKEEAMKFSRQKKFQKYRRNFSRKEYKIFLSLMEIMEHMDLKKEKKNFVQQKIKKL